METLKTIFSIFVLALIALGFLGLMLKPFISSRRDKMIKKHRTYKKKVFTFNPNMNSTDSTL